MRIIKIAKTTTAQSYQDLVQWLESQGKEIKQVIQEVTSNKPDALGGNANFWNIPNSNFGIRINRIKNSKVDGDHQQQEAPNDFGDVNVGQPIMNFGPVEIVRLQSGNPAGYPYLSKKDRESANIEDLKGQFLTRLKDAAEMPQQAYDKALRDIQSINQKGYVVDAGKSNNVLINAGQGFGFVDLNKMVPSSTGNSAGEFMTMLISNQAFEDHYHENEQAKAYAKEIIKKVEHASQITGLRLGRENGSVDFSYQLAEGYVKPTYDFFAPLDPNEIF